MGAYRLPLIKSPIGIIVGLGQLLALVGLCLPFLVLNGGLNHLVM